MFERFTDTAIQVIRLAQEEARRLGHNFIGTEQILLGLIAEGNGVAAQVLLSLGVTLKEAREQVEKIIGRGSSFVAAEMPFTP
ncbi:MAG: ATP-dependent Clp protease ATP-binding subunit ClpC, partial [Coleofasciculus sp. Co-bin14]|nr:ATP-dependent Clp protease ATP-binding subunit ClpC [Coleofasciculus sp. Co-bin14]